MRDVLIDLASDISIFVGANNSGKTSATQAIQVFISGAKEKLSLFDFSSSTWKQFDEIGDLEPTATIPIELPSIKLDLWFKVAANDLHLVLPLLPSTEWQGAEVGLRIEFAASNVVDLVQRFRTARTEALARAAALEGGPGDYVPWPKNLSDYLQKELHREFEFKYFVLDRAQFDGQYLQNEAYQPLPLTGEPKPASILKSLVQVDTLGAQRHLADPTSGSSAGFGRAEDLSRRLSRFYQRNLKQRQEDHAALKALFLSEEGLNKHLAEVFKQTLIRLGKLGYPGMHNPRLQIKSALNPATIMSSQDARVHYLVGDGTDAVALPDTYNGLGFKNLIYMVVEILDLHAKWLSDENRPPLHIIFIEEPEAHLHAQLQQVFIRNILDLLKVEGVDDGAFQSQLVVTTHSPHILYERGFKPVRYFRRQGADENQSTDVLNLSAFYDNTPDDRDFLQRYLKLTHCDLFFADAAILVEGNVERLLMPVMIDKEAAKLRSACLCVLEVGGAFGHRFKSLIEFLRLPVLVITDLDSVNLVAEGAEGNEDDVTEFDNPPEAAGQPVQKKRGTKCLPSTEGAVTSNQTLIQWLPKKKTIAELFAANVEDRIQQVGGLLGAKVCVAYQMPVDVTVGESTKRLCGRTLEEAFGLENAVWCQDAERRSIGLKLRINPTSPEALAEGLHRKVTGKGFDKTQFALGVLAESPGQWKVPSYIKSGLLWLSEEVDLDSPVEEPEDTAEGAPE